MLSLSPLEHSFVKAYGDCGGNTECISRALGRGVQDLKIIASNDVVRSAIQEEVQSSKKKFTVTKEDRLNLLWYIAEQGTKAIYDREGNEIMANAPASVAALRTMNDMVDDSFSAKPASVVVSHNTHTVDTRTESEISSNIKKLLQKYDRLKELDVALANDVPAIVSRSGLDVEDYDYESEEKEKEKEEQGKGASN